MLAEFPGLTSLELRYVPKISGMPPLANFPDLGFFVGWNIIEDAGKVFRSELRALKKQRTFQHAAATQLRTREWFESSYGLPYSGWPNAQAKRAIVAHRKAEAALAAATTSVEAETAVHDFVAGFNRFSGIATSEREDIGDAVEQLVAPASVAALISLDRALEIYDEVRNY